MKNQSTVIHLENVGVFVDFTYEKVSTQQQCNSLFVKDINVQGCRKGCLMCFIDFKVSLSLIIDR